MDFYENNLKSIQKYRDFMYNSIAKADDKSRTNRLEDINSFITKEDERSIQIKLESINYRLNSIYYPTMEAKKWVEQYEFSNLNNVISMFGFGNGVFAKAIINKMGEHDILIIYEPCADIFSHVMNNYDITDILKDSRVSISVEGINDFELHNAVRGVINITNLNDQITCIHPFYDQIFIESCIKFWKVLKESFTSIKININTEIHFGERFIDNMLNNIRFISKSNSIQELKEELPKDATAIIVAAGPSVEKQIENMKQAKGKSVIFAVDRILDYLLDAGLEPDYIVTLDPIKPIEYFSKRTDIKIPLICFLEANKEILNHHKGKKIISNCTDFLAPLYFNAKKIPPKVNSSTSVATVAFTACIELGFKDIILVGQDLAYNGMNSHAGGIAEECDDSKNVTIEDIYGKPIKSRYDWKEIINWYQDMLTVNPDLNVIDAKDNGAKIKGTTVMTLEDAVEINCKKEVNCHSIEQRDPTFNKEDIIYNKKFLENNINILDNIKKKSKDAIKACEFLIKESEKYYTETSAAKKANNKLRKISGYIEKQPIYSIMDHFVVAKAAQHLLGISHFTNNIKEDSLKTYEKSINIYEAVIEAVDYIVPRLEEAIRSVGNE